jgi:hypothetical protein
LSRGSNRSKRSQVDESLFGAKKVAGGASKNQIATSTGIISLDELRGIREKTLKNNKTDAVVISKGELDRIKGSTLVKTKEETIREKQEREDKRNEAMAVSKARKEKMMQLDQERTQKAKPSEFAVINKQKADGLLAKAQKQLDNDLDDVKHMN